MARRIDRWRMYLVCLAADMRDSGAIDEAQYRRIVGRVDEMDACDVVRVVEAMFPSPASTATGCRDA